MVTALRLFHGSLALWTVLNPQTLLGFVQGQVPT